MPKHRTASMSVGERQTQFREQHPPVIPAVQAPTKRLTEVALLAQANALPLPHDSTKFFSKQRVSAERDRIDISPAGPGFQRDRMKNAQPWHQRIDGLEMPRLDKRFAQSTKFRS